VRGVFTSPCCCKRGIDDVQVALSRALIGRILPTGRNFSGCKKIQAELSLYRKREMISPYGLDDCHDEKKDK
jgi:hypothetical protein